MLGLNIFLSIPSHEIKNKSPILSILLRVGYAVALELSFKESKYRLSSILVILNDDSLTVLFVNEL